MDIYTVDVHVAWTKIYSRMLSIMVSVSNILLMSYEFVSHTHALAHTYHTR